VETAFSCLPSSDRLVTGMWIPPDHWAWWLYMVWERPLRASLRFSADLADQKCF